MVRMEVSSKVSMDIMGNMSEVDIRGQKVKMLIITGYHQRKDKTLPMYCCLFHGSSSQFSGYQRRKYCKYKYLTGKSRMHFHFWSVNGITTI